MKFLRSMYFYKSTPGAVIAIVLGSVALVIDAFLLMLFIVHHQPRDSTPTRVKSMIFYLVLGAVLISGGAVSLRQIDTRRRAQVQADAERAAADAQVAQWDLPMGDPRRSDNAP
jgi:heme A synthase